MSMPVIMTKQAAGWGQLFKVWAHIMSYVETCVDQHSHTLLYVSLNDYMGPLIYLIQQRPMSVGLANFQLMYGGTPYHC